MVAHAQGLGTPRSRSDRLRRTRRRVALAVVRVSRSPSVVAQGVAAVVILVIAALLLQACSGTTPPSGSPTASLPTGVGQIPGASASPSPTPLSASTPPPVPLVAAPTDGVLETAEQAAAPVLAVMIDDAPAARPQSGLAAADILIQAPAEGGIPRYVALFQSATAPAIGPIRSSRRYFLGWAAAWRPLYAHVGGAPNALAALRTMNGNLVWDADEFAWAAYMPRISARVAPHNVYTSSRQLDTLARRLGVRAAPATPWTFVDPAPTGLRPTGGSLTVAYPAGVISYEYDGATDRYLRSVDGTPQVDAGSGARVAPFDVVVLWVAVGPLANAPGALTNQLKGRLEVGYLGSGRALVLCDGQAIQARWSKTSDAAPLLLTEVGGTDAGQPVTLVRGQIAIQVVPEGTAVALELGRVPGIGPQPQ